jgi:hypothetical protein
MGVATQVCQRDRNQRARSSTSLLLGINLATGLGSVALSQANPVPAQFGPITNFPAGSYPGAMVLADFNRDGNQDIAVTTSSVRLLLGRGNGAFAAPTNLPAWGSRDLSIGDFNKDGNMDLANLGDYSGVVLLGDGRGGFPVITNSIAVHYPSVMAVGDFNADGKLDVAVVSLDFPYYVAVASGRGDGSFNDPTNHTIADLPYDLRAADIRGNGNIDLVVALGPSPVRGNSFCVLANRGDGSFAPPQYYVAAADQHRSLELADFNGDGAPDVALLNYNAQSVTIRLNLQDGTFGTTNHYFLGFPPSNVGVGDFNGDGMTDLIVRGGAAVALLYGHGDGAFTVGSQMSVPSDSGLGHQTVVVGDLNGDGMPDLALANSVGNSVAVLLNQTPPTLQIAPMRGYNQVSWPGTFGAGFTLEWTTNLLAPGSWQPFLWPPVVIGSQRAVTDWTDGERKFYRLRKP